MTKLPSRLASWGRRPLTQVIARQAKVIGVPTACVLWVSLGDPRNYHARAAYRKAMGLNLKERSSGKHRGRLKITRRGPGIVRKWLYFAAMRTVKLPEVKSWYEMKKAKDGDRGKGALVGVMRRLAPRCMRPVLVVNPMNHGDCFRAGLRRASHCRTNSVNRSVTNV